MSKDVTRGPICPSCGEESLPTAARCWLCFTPLGGTVQTTPAPAPGESGLPPPRRQPTAPPRSGCATAAAWIGVAVLTVISAGVTFFLVCSATFAMEANFPQLRLPEPAPKYAGDDSGIGVVIAETFCPATVAAAAVAMLIVVAFARRRRG